MRDLALAELTWEVDSHGYTLDEKGSLLQQLRDAFSLDESADGHVVPCVVPCGGPPEYYSCKADDLDALCDFLNMRETPDGVLHFVRKWGLLKPTSEQDYQRVEMFIDNRYVLAHCITKGLPRRAGGQMFGGGHVVVGGDGGRSFHANTLVDFLWAQVALRPQARRDIYQCPCKRFALRKTPRGPEAKKKLGRTPTYCSDACKSWAYRQELTGRVADGGRRNRGAPRARTRARAHAREC
jgi:hypothetical protein